MCNFYDPEDFLRDGVTSVDMSTLTEGDKECTICYDHFVFIWYTFMLPVDTEVDNFAAWW
jgi:hypothetical protein